MNAERERLGLLDSGGADGEVGGVPEACEEYSTDVREGQYCGGI